MKKHRVRVVEIGGEQYIQLRALPKILNGLTYDVLDSRLRLGKYPNIGVKHLGGGRYLHVNIIEELKKEFDENGSGGT